MIVYACISGKLLLACVNLRQLTFVCLSAVDIAVRYGTNYGIVKVNLYNAGLTNARDSRFVCKGGGGGGRGGGGR